jgi:hypothetical protein
VETVFPSLAIRENTASKDGFTLKAGQYEYPFKIRIPINSACTEEVKPSTGVAGSLGIPGGLLQRVSFDANHGTVDFAKESKVHVKGTLPPSLSGIADDAAWIKYFLKATVNRPAFYKTNMRQTDPIVFLPIEPPRSPPTNAEAFAKRKHEIIVAPKPSMNGFLNTFRRAGSEVPVRFTIEARLPSPPILVPNDPLPLRLLLTKLDPFKDMIVMRSLQLTLLGTTKITAHELVKDELTNWLLLSVASINVPFGDANAPANMPLEVDPSLWRDICLPDTVPPTFTTCNISRSYQLKIEIGLGRPHDEHFDVYIFAPTAAACRVGTNIATQILPLLFPIQVYSGIQPPPQLIAAATLPPPQPPRPKAQHESSTDLAPSPMLSSRPSSKGSAKGIVGDHEEEIMAPPPTYEDAVAEGISPIDGPRRRYEQEGTYFAPLPDDLREPH